MHVPAFAFLTLAALARAITVESPSTGDDWLAGNSQTVEWKAVSTDPSSFAIQLVNQQGYLTNSPVTLVSSQNTGTSDQVNSATVSYPSGSWPTGKGFQINLVTISGGNTAILAQSGQFNITSGGSSSSASSASSVSSSSAASTSKASTAAVATSTIKGSSTIPAVTAGGNGASSTSDGSILNSTSQAVSDGLLSSKPSVLISALMGVAAFVGVTF